MSSVPERDWKKLRSMKDELLDDACNRILIKIKMLIEKNYREKHKTYLKLWKTLRKEDKKIAEMFDDLKRGNALYKIAALVRYNIINEEALKQFTTETQERVEEINQNWR